MLLSQNAADKLFGGTGNDFLSGGPNSELYGEDGDDIITYDSSVGLPRVISGGAGSDKLLFNGTSAADLIVINRRNGHRHRGG